MTSKPIGYREGSEYARLHDDSVELVQALLPGYTGDLTNGISAMAEVLRIHSSSVLKYLLLLTLMKVEKVK